MEKKFIVVIPARLKSSRLPNKPLLTIKGVPMIIRTFKQCNKVVKKENIFVATDSSKIASLCREHNINTVITSSKCKTGTDRVFEVSKKIKAENYINVQGDEPIFNPKDLTVMISNLSRKKNYNKVLLGYCEFNSKKIMNNKNIPKVIFDKNNKLLYATRSPVPSLKQGLISKGYRQVLVYVYPKIIIKNFKKIYNKKKLLEKSEDIEILRFLENGINVRLIKMSDQSKSVDTIKDLNTVRKLIN
jgi:3-deoxy-manno-octulosonate cytidylyltransferase (CMP-KDO synthetase)